MLDKRLNDKGKNWRHVLKSLKVLDYCLHEGSELVVTWARKNVYIIKTLREFQYVDEDGRDVGQNGRWSCDECLHDRVDPLLTSGISCLVQFVLRQRNLPPSFSMRTVCAVNDLTVSSGNHG